MTCLNFMDYLSSFFVTIFYSFNLIQWLCWLILIQFGNLIALKKNIFIICNNLLRSTYFCYICNLRSHNFVYLLWLFNNIRYLNRVQGIWFFINAIAKFMMLIHNNNILKILYIEKIFVKRLNLPTKQGYRINFAAF